MAGAAADEPSFADGTCANLVCHAPERGDNRGFVWDEPETVGCTGCHGAPPPPPHPESDGCAQLTCHGGEVGVGQSGAAAGTPSITADGRSLHMDGHVQSQAP